MNEFRPVRVLCGIKMGVYNPSREVAEQNLLHPIINQISRETGLRIIVENTDEGRSTAYSPVPFITRSYSLEVYIDHPQDWVGFAGIQAALADRTLKNPDWFFLFRTKGGSARYCTYNTPEKIRSWTGKSFETLFN